MIRSTPSQSVRNANCKGRLPPSPSFIVSHFTEYMKKNLSTNTIFLLFSAIWLLGLDYSRLTILQYANFALIGIWLTLIVIRISKKA
jgi:hypothetical protein